jgi:hypothetical protein
MAKRKFGALAEFRQLTTDDVMEAPPTPPTAASPQEAPAELARPAVAEAARGKGRPPGKRSNPEWKLYSHFLKKKTQRQAAAHLAALDDGRDLSDVLQELLERWLAG